LIKSIAKVLNFGNVILKKNLKKRTKTRDFCMKRLFLDAASHFLGMASSFVAKISYF